MFYPNVCKYQSVNIFLLTYVTNKVIPGTLVSLINHAIIEFITMHYNLTNSKFQGRDL